MFIPRHPVVENQFCMYNSQTSDATGVGGVIAYAGSVVRLDPTATNEEPMVEKLKHADGATYPAFGMLMQKVKSGYHQVHPTGFMMPGDLGSSDVIAQPSYNSSTGAINGTKEAPVGVAHLGIWDTVHYTAAMSVAGTPDNALTPGTMLWPAADEAKLTNSTANSDGATDEDTGAQINGWDGTYAAVAMVLKGASVAKAAANIANTTLYPIRVKLFV